MPAPVHHLAQINVARMRAPLTGELMAGFVAELAPVNALADRSPGFVWRLQSEGSDATSIRVFPDEMLLVNISVWESLDALKAFVYRSHHSDVLRQREQWFERMQGFHTALWWLPAGEIPAPWTARRGWSAWRRMASHPSLSRSRSLFLLRSDRARIR